MADKRTEQWQDAFAKARLERAAPDLLAALKAAKSRLERRDATNEWRINSALNVINATIAKAEGRV